VRQAVSGARGDIHRKEQQQNGNHQSVSSFANSETAPVPVAPAPAVPAASSLKSSSNKNSHSLKPTSKSVGPDGSVVVNTTATAKDTGTEQTAASATSNSHAGIAASSIASASTGDKKPLYQSSIPKGSDTRLTKDIGADEVDRKLLITAIVMILVVVGIVVGAVVGVTQKNKNNDGESPATTAPTTGEDTPTMVPSGPITTPTMNDQQDGSDPFPWNTNNPNAPEACERDQYPFEETSLILLMAVDPAINDIEMTYAATVLQKTYQALLDNSVIGPGDVDGDNDNALYCDPYCRQITSVSVVNSTLMESTTESSTSNVCTSNLELVFALSGTYSVCQGEDPVFPGLFTEPSANDNVFDSGTRRRQMLSLSKSLAMSLPTMQNSRYLRNKKNKDKQQPRELQQAQEQSTCRACPDSTDSMGILAPTTQQLLEAMGPFVYVLPAVCEIISVELVDVVPVDNDTEMTTTTTSEP